METPEKIWSLLSEKPEIACPKCQHSLYKSPSPICSECGYLCTAFMVEPVAHQKHDALFWEEFFRTPGYVCPGCGYSLDGARSSICSECGYVCTITHFLRQRSPVSTPLSNKAMWNARWIRNLGVICGAEWMLVGVLRAVLHRSSLRWTLVSLLVGICVPMVGLGVHALLDRFRASLRRASLALQLVITIVLGFMLMSVIGLIVRAYF
jgi:hypothetical protein